MGTKMLANLQDTDVHHEPVAMEVLKAEVWGPSAGERTGTLEPGSQVWDVASLWDTGARPMFAPCGKATATWFCRKTRCF